jgi:hypothetical protein
MVCGILFSVGLRISPKGGMLRNRIWDLVLNPGLEYNSYNNNNLDN